jgi:MFS family permease
MLLVLRQTPTLPLLLVMVLAQGLLGYALTSVFPAIPAEIFESRHYGPIFGSLMSASIAGGAAGPFFTGLLFDATGSYDAGFWVAFGFSLLAILAIWCAAPRKIRAVAGRIAKPV